MLHEQVDDLPVLLAHLEQMGVAALLDTHFPTHGNWQGLSLGTVASVWLTHLLSQGDHCLCHVEPWAAARSLTLQACLGQPVDRLDFTDDRLAAVLRALSDDDGWQAFEAALSRRLLRVYALTPQQVRIDTTTASSYGRVTAEGLLQFGPSKDHRPDLPQLKILAATLDPLGLPVATTVLPGHRADDPLYLPAIRRVRAVLGQRGLLYIGDCKMASQETRATVAADGDYYLCPLPEKQLADTPLETLLAPVWRGTQALTSVYRPEGAEGAEGADASEPADPSHGREAAPPIAEGFARTFTWTYVREDTPFTWQERRLVVRSGAHAAAEEAALRARLARAHTALTALNQRGRGKRRYRTRAALQTAAAALLARYGVAELLTLTYAETETRREVRRYRRVAAEVRVEYDYQVTVQVNEAALAAAIRRLGWRVYATNLPTLPLAQAVWAYREQYVLERGFARLKGQPLSLTPLYLQREAHILGLVRLLLVALRALCLIEHGVREQLAATRERLDGVYAGNPKRRTARPSTELLLQAFRGIALILVPVGNRYECHLSRYTPKHEEILALMGLSGALYRRLCTDSCQPP
jgi:transposase